MYIDYVMLVYAWDRFLCDYRCLYRAANAVTSIWARNPTIRTTDIRVRLGVVIGNILYLLLLCHLEPNPLTGGHPIVFRGLPCRNVD